MSIETGDIVKHLPSGETWVVAYCERGGVCPCGWPEMLARESDCELVEKRTVECREDLLRRTAKGYGDSRCSYALRVFAERAKALESLDGAGI